MLYIWKHHKQERLGEERKRLDLCSRLLCARHPPSAAGPAPAGRLGSRAGAGLYHGDGGPVLQHPRPSAARRTGCSGAGFNLPNRGFSWPFLDCQVSLRRGLAVSLGGRSTETSSSSPCGGWTGGWMEPELPPLRTGMGSISRPWPGVIWPPEPKGAGRGCWALRLHAAAIQSGAGCSEAPQCPTQTP